MTKDLIWARLSDAARHAITARGYHLEPSRYGPSPISITLALIEDGNRHLCSMPGLDLPCPVRILQGDEDPDVAYDHALQSFRCPARRRHPPSP